MRLDEMKLTEKYASTFLSIQIRQVTTHRAMIGIKATIKTISHNFVLLQNALVDRVVTTY